MRKKVIIGTITASELDKTLTKNMPIIGITGRKSNLFYSNPKEKTQIVAAEKTKIISNG
jgi:hypothetical protein